MPALLSISLAPSTLSGGTCPWEALHVFRFRAEGYLLKGGPARLLLIQKPKGSFCRTFLPGEWSRTFVSLFLLPWLGNTRTGWTKGYRTCCFKLLFNRRKKLGNPENNQPKEIFLWPTWKLTRFWTSKESYLLLPQARTAVLWSFLVHRYSLSLPLQPWNVFKGLDLFMVDFSYDHLL